MQRLVITPKQKQATQIFLTPEQCHYLRRVLRLRTGDRFVALDGAGRSWIVQLEEDAAQVVDTLAESLTELPVTVTLMMSLPKGSGFDEVVRCCTELGVTTLMPITSTRTLLRPSPKKLERWRRIAQEATEQSERQIVPTITDVLGFTAALAEISQQETNRYICVARGDVPHLLNSLEATHPITLAVGCEGGWTQAEVESAIAHQFQPVSLGRRVLRAVTAPMTALSLVAATLEKD